MVTVVLERPAPLPVLSRAAAFSVIPEKDVNDIKDVAVSSSVVLTRSYSVVL